MTNDEELALETLKRRKACMENSPTIEPHYLSDLPDEIIKSLQTVAIDVSDGFVVFERKRPQGEWEKHITYFECSNCKHCYDYDYAEDIDPVTDLNFSFCPNCGADMRGAT